MDLALHGAHLRRPHLGVERRLRLPLEGDLLVEQHVLLLRLRHIEQQAAPSAPSAPTIELSALTASPSSDFSFSTNSVSIRKLSSARRRCLSLWEASNWLTCRTVRWDEMG